jgi:hypothetical protein
VAGAARPISGRLSSQGYFCNTNQPLSTLIASRILLHAGWSWAEGVHKMHLMPADVRLVFFFFRLIVLDSFSIVPFLPNSLSTNFFPLVYCFGSYSLFFWYILYFIISVLPFTQFDFLCTGLVL